MEGAGHQKTYLPKVSFTTCRIRLLLLTVDELFSFIFGSDPLFPQQSGKKTQRKGEKVQDTLRKKPEPLILQSKYKHDLEVFQKITLYSLESRISSAYCWTTINHFLVHPILLETYF